MSYQKVYDLLVQPSSTTGLRSQVLLSQVLKGTDPLVDLPEQVVSLLGEVRVHLDEMDEVDDESEMEDEMLNKIEEEERKRNASLCPLQ